MLAKETLWLKIKEKKIATVFLKPSSNGRHYQTNGKPAAVRSCIIIALIDRGSSLNCVQKIINQALPECVVSFMRRTTYVQSNFASLSCIYHTCGPRGNSI